MITRDNYEGFFLLYADNELSVSQKEEVERFVAHHPDLQEEWETLLQCRVSPEESIGFPGKESLRQPEVGQHSYTDYFLSYIDGELNTNDRAIVEDILRRHPQHWKELELLRATISQPDPAIVFPEKNSLYRKEKDRRIIALPWVRICAAAVLAGAVALLFLLPGSRHTLPPAPVAGQAPAGSGMTPASHKKIVVPVTPVTIAALYLAKGSTHTERADTKKVRQAAGDPRLTQTIKKDMQSPNGEGHTDENTAALVKTVDPDKGSRNIDPATSISMQNGTAERDMASDVHLAVQTDIPKEQSSFATQALQEEANDQKDINLVADEQAVPGKSKLRGIFRKVTRVFGKTADRDKDGNRQVLVGAFQIAIN